MAGATVKGCPGCGVVLDFAKIQSKPFKVCPVCSTPLEHDAAVTQQHWDDVTALTNEASLI